MLKNFLSDCKIAALGTLLSLASLTALPATWAYADGNVSVFVKDDVACSDPRLLKMIELAEAPKEWKWLEAQVVFQGQKLAACAAPVGDRVVVIDEQGDAGAVPQGQFHKLKEA